MRYMASSRVLEPSNFARALANSTEIPTNARRHTHCYIPVFAVCCHDSLWSDLVINYVQNFRADPSFRDSEGTQLGRS